MFTFIRLSERKIFRKLKVQVGYKSELRSVGSQLQILHLKKLSRFYLNVCTQLP
jgi:hypothetical protein